MALNQLNGQARFTNTTATDNDELVLPQKLLLTDELAIESFLQRALLRKRRRPCHLAWRWEGDRAYPRGGGHFERGRILQSRVNVCGRVLLMERLKGVSVVNGSCAEDQSRRCLKLAGWLSGQTSSDTEKKRQTGGRRGCGHYGQRRWQQSLGRRKAKSSRCERRMNGPGPQVTAWRRECSWIWLPAME